MKKKSIWFICLNKILYKKTKVAINEFIKRTDCKKVKLVVAGGVAANQSIRDNLIKLNKEFNCSIIYPDIKFCGDNAAMIAWAGIQRYNKKLFNIKDEIVRSRWPLDDSAPFLKGSGLIY